MVSVFLLVKSMRGPHGLCNSEATDLSAEGREGRLVLGVDGPTAGSRTLFGASASGRRRAPASTTATFPSTSSTTSTSTLASASTSPTTRRTGIRGGVILTIKSERVLGLVLLGTVLLGTGAGEVLLVNALDGLALRELLAGTLVGLADGEAVAGKSLALLLKVGKVLLVGLGVVLLGLGGCVHTIGTSRGSRVGAVVVLSFGSGEVGTGLLVSPLGATLLEAPAVTGLLLVLTIGVSVT